MEDGTRIKVLSVNLSGAFYMSKAALEHMLERGSGRIINISSIVGQIGNIGQTNCGVESGMFGMTITMAREVAFNLSRAGVQDRHRVGLTVNTVAPGFIETEMLDTVPEKVLDRIRSQIPSVALGGPRRSPAWSTSSRPITRATSPARSGRSTAARNGRPSRVRARQRKSTEPVSGGRRPSPSEPVRGPVSEPVT